jgi:signal peptidase I
MFKNRCYSLRKSRQIFKTSYKWYKKKGDTLSPSQLVILENQLQELDQAIVLGEREKANALARQVEAFASKHCKKGFFEYIFEVAVALAFALVLATIIRQVWFELYEIPSGSMRPTFEEQDRLTVTKTTFGINVPLLTKHFYFDPSLVQRAGVVIWSGDGIAHLDSDSTFLGVFPYMKRYIKRCMAKPGDTLYFYGGQLYGFDEAGNDLMELRNNPWLAKLEHIPFVHFEGRTSYLQEPKQTMTSKVVFHHLNQPVGRLNFGLGAIKGEIFNGKEWIKDEPEAQRVAHDSIRTYSDFIGLRNFAMARLLTKEQVKNLTNYNLEQAGEGKLYLELRHTPSLSYPQPLLERYGVFLTGYTTLLPLQEQHVKALMDHMYTARFVIRDGKADRYRQEESPRFSASSPLFAKIPDGTYEFYYGKAYQIGWGGVPSLLGPEHPLYDLSNVQKLFNVGIEISNEIAPKSRNQPLFPNRYAYFREGDLYLLGVPILKKDDPTLVRFEEQEMRKEKASTTKQPYVAFKDYGPPVMENGQIDKDFIRTFGFKVPEKEYLMLGDNHAMSQDSRYFGPVPQANLQGTPSLILWPPSSHWGLPNQKPYPLFTLPRLIVWSVFGLVGLVWYLIYRWNLRRPMFKKRLTHSNT